MNSVRTARGDYLDRDCVGRLDLELCNAHVRSAKTVDEVLLVTMSILDVDHGLDSSNEWGQFVDIEDTAETKASRQSRFLSLFCFYNNGTNNAQKRRQGQSQNQTQGDVTDVKETTKQDAIEQPHEDSDFEDEDDSYDSDSDASDSEEDFSDAEEVIRSDARYVPSAHVNSKQKNASAIMKKLYRSVSITKSKRSTVILPENVLQHNLESKQSVREEQDSSLEPIEIISKTCMKNEPQCGACTCVSCSPNSFEVPTCTSNIAQVTGRMLDIATDNQRKISLSLSEAADILVALHPKASKDQNVARKLKIQFQKADESKQKQVVARLPREKLLSLLSTIRAQS